MLANPVWVVSQSPASPELLFLHSAQPTDTFGVKPVPDRVTVCRWTRPVDGVTVSDGSTNAAGTSAAAAGGPGRPGRVPSGPACRRRRAPSPSGAVVSGVVASGAVVSPAPSSTWSSTARWSTAARRHRTPAQPSPRRAPRRPSPTPPVAIDVASCSSVPLEPRAAQRYEPNATFRNLRRRRRPSRFTIRFADARAPTHPHPGPRQGRAAVRQRLRVARGGERHRAAAGRGRPRWCGPTPTPLGYTSWWHHQLTIGPGDLAITESLVHWVNDALMAVFFFVVGLEIKRELVVGELRDRHRAALPADRRARRHGGARARVRGRQRRAVADSTAGRSRWPPTSRSRSGVLALLGPRVPSSLKLFLLTLAIVDDIGAIVVIALFYSRGSTDGGSGARCSSRCSSS